MWRIDLALMWTGAILALLTVVIPMLLPNEVTPLPSSSHPDPTPYRALVVGSTGAVGRSLVRFLADSYQVSRVGVVVRHHPQWYHPKESERARHVRKTFRLSVEQAEKVAIIPIQFEVLHHPDAFESYRQTFSGWDKGFSAIGTTYDETAAHKARDSAEQSNSFAGCSFSLESLLPTCSFPLSACAKPAVRKRFAWSI